MAYRVSLLSPCKTLINLFPRQQFSIHPNRLIPNFLTRTRTHMSTESLQKSPFESNVSTESLRKSPFESNVLRILRNEIVYQSEYAPPHQVNSRSFAVSNLLICLVPEKTQENKRKYYEIVFLWTLCILFISFCCWVFKYSVLIAFLM